MICKAYKTSPTAAVQVLVGTPPFDLVIEREGAIGNVTRLRRQHTLWGETYNHEEYEEHRPVIPRHPAENNIDTYISISRAVRDIQPTGLFTDGSKTSAGTGNAFCPISDGKVMHVWKRRLAHYNSVYQAELLAISAALKYSAEVEGAPTQIYSDSASSLAAIVNERSRSSLVQEIRR
ncbi:uncharacterized protein LOC118197158 [Stegodyphus dumicola]|uniref:uncharacterized protein LOC118197158 n=1 Tax=Stegodyphus dumicola TaxID=202533 RepID=UPI0015B075AC|nr:uncharacterized protein LOC118197158 [Stegodyphus dumicola]